MKGAYKLIIANFLAMALLNSLIAQEGLNSTTNNKIKSTEQKLHNDTVASVLAFNIETEKNSAEDSTLIKKEIEIANIKSISSLFEKIEAAFGITGIFEGAVGSKDKINRYQNVSDASTSMDIELTLPLVDYGTTYAHFEAGKGDGIDGDITTISGFNYDADDNENLRMTELWSEHKFLNEAVAIRIGKIDITTNFDLNNIANDETAQFLSPGFRNNSAIEFPDNNSAGLMLWFNPSQSLNIGLGFSDADADWNKVFDDLFSIMEIDYLTTIGEREGVYRIYGWHNSKNHDDLLNTETGPKNNYGLGLSVDQQLTEIISLFGRWGWQRGDVARHGNSFSCGVQCSGSVFGRAEDTFGAAYGISAISNNGKTFDLLNSVNTASERHIEFYYNFKAHDFLTISPDLQWIGNPNGDKNNSSIFVFGLRTQLSI